MVRDILFDLDDTLFDFAADERVALEQTLAELGITMTEHIHSRYHAINQAQWEALERGEITRGQVKQRRFELLFQELQQPTAWTRDAAKRYQEYLAQGFHFMPGAPQLLKRLHTSYRLFLVSNGNLPVQEERLAKAGIAPYFSGIFISEVVGAEKPNPEFFVRAFADVEDFDRAAAVIVGDSLTSDILGGKNFGVRTVWFNAKGAAPSAQIPADYEIHALCELPELLGRL